MSFEESLDALMGLLEPKKEAIKEICQTCESEFSFIFEIYADADESTPEVHLELRHLEMINYFGSECDFDIVLLSDTPPDDNDDEW